MRNACDQHHNGQVILCDVKEDFRELTRKTLPNVGWLEHLEFSPGKGEYLLLVSDFLDREICVLDSETLEEPAWSKCFRALALPAGKVCDCTVTWVSPACSRQESLNRHLSCCAVALSLLCSLWLVPIAGIYTILSSPSHARVNAIGG